MRRCVCDTVADGRPRDLRCPCEFYDPRFSRNAWCAAEGAGPAEGADRGGAAQDVLEGCGRDQRVRLRLVQEGCVGSAGWLVSPRTSDGNDAVRSSCLQCLPAPRVRTPSTSTPLESPRSRASCTASSRCRPWTARGFATSSSPKAAPSGVCSAATPTRGSSGLARGCVAHAVRDVPVPMTGPCAGQPTTPAHALRRR